MLLLLIGRNPKSLKTDRPLKWFFTVVCTLPMVKNSIKYIHKGETFLVSCREDLCEVGPKTPSVFKFSNVLFALK